MTPRPFKSMWSVLACAIMLASTAATSACGESENPTSSPKITLGFSAWVGWLPWQVAHEQGLFARNGVNVEVKYFESYTDSMNALATSAIDANSQTLNDTIVSISGGAKQVIVLVNDNSTGNDKIIAREGINSVSDLKGKTIAVEEGTVDHYLLLLALEAAGLTGADVEIKPLITDAAAAAFVAGQVDAVGAFTPYTTTALERPGSRAIATSAEFPGAIPDHLVFTAEFVKSRPKDVQAIVNTWFDTLEWIKEHRDAAMEIMAKIGGVSVEEYKTYEAGTTFFTTRQNLDAFTPGTTPEHLNFQAAEIVDFMVGTGLVQARPELDGLLDDSFVKAVPE